jgi:hypothetical protein
MRSFFAFAYSEWTIEMKKNADIEWELAQGIPGYLRKLGLLPKGYGCDVHLLRGSRKKRRDAAFEGNWDPQTDSIRVVFSPMEEEVEVEAAQVAAFAKASKGESQDDRLSDLLRALDRAESRPGYEFVSLKWFRDTALPGEDFSWVADEAARHDMLREAIDRRWILTRKVANPRPPNFPVTAIRLNWQLREVNAALGRQNDDSAGFRPVKIRGQPLSATVLHDRR